MCIVSSHFSVVSIRKILGETCADDCQYIPSHPDSLFPQALQRDGHHYESSRHLETGLQEEGAPPKDVGRPPCNIGGELQHTHTHAHARARTHAHTHTRTHAHTHTRTHAHTHTRTHSSWASCPALHCRLMLISCCDTRDSWTRDRRADCQGAKGQMDPGGKASNGQSSNGQSSNRQSSNRQSSNRQGSTKCRECSVDVGVSM